MSRIQRLVITASAAFAMAALGALPAHAADQPGDSCSTPGQVKPLGSGTIVCQGGTWQPGSAAPGGQPPAGAPAGGTSPAAAGSSSKVATAKIFVPIGTALSSATFGSGGKQVADATAWRTPDGRVRLFAFSDDPSRPGLHIATSTTPAGTTFVAETAVPFTDIIVGQPRAWALGGNSLRLYYVQAGNVDTAVSADGGLTWTKEGSVLTTAQAGFEPGVISLIKTKSGYRAYFSNLEKPGEHAARVMKTATSTDLVHWTVGPTVVSGGGSHPFAVANAKGVVALYYAADRGSSYGLFVSTAKDGVHFKGEKLVVPGSADADIIANGASSLMYYGADLGAQGFGVKVAKSVGKVVP